MDIRRIILLILCSLMTASSPEAIHGHCQSLAACKVCRREANSDSSIECFICNEGHALKSGRCIKVDDDQRNCLALSPDDNQHCIRCRHNYMLTRTHRCEAAAETSACLSPLCQECSLHVAVCLKCAEPFVLSPDFDCVEISTSTERQESPPETTESVNNWSQDFAIWVVQGIFIIAITLLAVIYCRRKLAHKSDFYTYIN